MATSSAQSDTVKQRYPAVWAAAMEKAKAMGLLNPPEANFDLTKRNQISKFKTIATHAIMSGLHIKTIENGEILVWESGVYRCGGQRLIGAICQALG